MKILVVDDEEGARELFNTILTDEGYEVTLPINGEDALARFTNAPFDLVVTDIRCPGWTASTCWRRSGRPAPRPTSSW